MVEPVLTEPTKVCAYRHCPYGDGRQPWSNFYVRTHWQDGTTRNVLAYCKHCHNIVTGGTPEAWQRLKRDPVRLAARRRRQARAQREYRERRGERVGARTHLDPAPQIVAAPFAAWLLYVVRRDESTQKDTAERLGMTERAFSRIVKGQRMVELATVERAVIADGGHLDDIYPYAAVA